ncbi:MAG: hypothetical protein M3Z21_15265 [Pseudomonadota bacterium]|nr:hypothetical protein [Pseudomonadota bacterium]
MTPATTNLIVRNAGGTSASDAALIKEAKAIAAARKTGDYVPLLSLERDLEKLK